MTTPLDKIKLAYDEMVAKYKVAIEDGRISFGDALSLFIDGAFQVVKLIQPYAELPYEERKKIGIDLATQFYVDIIKPLDIPGVPSFLESYIDEAIEDVVPALVAMVYESIHDAVYSKLD